MRKKINEALRKHFRSFFKVAYYTSSASNHSTMLIKSKRKYRTEMSLNKLAFRFFSLSL